MQTRILTHRGLDPARPNYFKESSYEAFEDQLSRGYGLEFDPQISSSGTIVVTHKKDEIDNPETVRLADLLKLIEAKAFPDAIMAVHVKHSWQDEASIDMLLDELSKINCENVILFDLKIETAKYIKSKNSRLQLAASVAHPYDIERYNTAVGGTLLSLEEVIAHKNLFEWVWLDEWDLAGKDGGFKKFYTAETFTQLRDCGFKIALVTPELHATSPGLLGGESHADAQSQEILVRRHKEILELNPDAICTDYPDNIRQILEG